MPAPRIPRPVGAGSYGTLREIEYGLEKLVLAMVLGVTSSGVGKNGGKVRQPPMVALSGEDTGD